MTGSPSRANSTTHRGVDEKTCAVCGRRIEWRRNLAKNWDQVRYCSDSCRRHRRLSDIDRALESHILELLESRSANATICPSEAARRVRPDWRPLMDQARNAARRLVAEGDIVILQSGRVVDPSTARGPIRLRLVRDTETQ